MSQNVTPSAPRISHLSDLTPPSLERAWSTTPHPALPIVATCGADKTVRIYSLTNFKLLSTISGGHKRSVRTCAWKPLVKGESVLATGSFDATVGIWRRWDSYGREEGGNQAWEIDDSKADGEENHYGEDGVAAGGRRSLRHEDDHDAEAEDEEWRFAVLLDGHDSEVKSVSWSPSGILLATCARDKSIWIWEDLDDGDNNFETVAVLQEHSGDVKCVSWHPTEECLASGSYDDTIRVWREDIDDWGQVACLRGHHGTVWYIDWEGADNAPSPSSSLTAEEIRAVKDRWKGYHALSGPRLISCSDDRTVRVWRRQPKRQSSSAGVGMPSIIRPVGLDETWYEEAVLPAAHALSIYAVTWSKRTGLVATAGADGRIVVYEERFVSADATGENLPGEGDKMEVEASPSSAVENQTDGHTTAPVPPSLQTQWVILASLDAAHGIYELNHISWAKRADRRRHESSVAGQEEEILITTADDGSVKAWTVEQ
jgi:WD40 repeat protein